MLQRIKTDGAHCISRLTVCKKDAFGSFMLALHLVQLRDRADSNPARVWLLPYVAEEVF